MTKDSSRPAEQPETFANLQEVRQRIDALDEHIIALLAERFSCVKIAAHFKRNTEEVKAPDRFVSMLLQRRNWATANGLNPDIIEQMFKLLVEYFIEEELKRWRSDSADNKNK